MSAVERLYTSRRFMSVLWSQVLAVVAYFAAKYAAPALADDVKFVIGAMDVVVTLLIVAYTVDDIHERNAMAALQHKALEQGFLVDVPDDAPEDEVYQATGGPSS